jgi:hypothetical protein
MKTLKQKRQTSGRSGLKQSTSTFPLRNFLKHLEAGGESQNGKPHHAVPVTTQLEHLGNKYTRA